MKRVPFLGVLLTIALLVTLPVLAESYETYTYVDANGTVHYVEDLGKVPTKYRTKARPLVEMDTISIIESDPTSSGKTGTGKRQTGKKRFEGTIEMYVTSWCPVCKDAEGYITKMGYPYVKYDVEKDSAARKRNDGYPGRGVPLVVVGDKNFRGFSPDTLEHYLGK